MIKYYQESKAAQVVGENDSTLMNCIYRSAGYRVDKPSLPTKRPAPDIPKLFSNSASDWP